ncbi:hypothetical protein EVAR_78822_1 [Eumeta japonica]|uniref:Uncharacterized protein n=1 Tax=Eumeta variegata TaxID=151549 RepID=A0A4C1T1L7_EUMVA|nr:hypothetical protein EVAR_78822_1 [Eumeta japonica]
MGDGDYLLSDGSSVTTSIKKRSPKKTAETQEVKLKEPTSTNQGHNPLLPKQKTNVPIYPEPQREGDEETMRICYNKYCCVRPLSLFYSDASADGVEERSLVPCSRSRVRLRRNATMSHAFSCVQPAFIDL